MLCTTYPLGRYIDIIPTWGLVNVFNVWSEYFIRYWGDSKVSEFFVMGQSKTPITRQGFFFGGGVELWVCPQLIDIMNHTIGITNN
jgi:hypothetical protein